MNIMEWRIMINIGDPNLFGAVLIFCWIFCCYGTFSPFRSMLYLRSLAEQLLSNVLCQDSLHDLYERVCQLKGISQEKVDFLVLLPNIFAVIFELIIIPLLSAFTDSIRQVSGTISISGSIHFWSLLTKPWRNLTCKWIKMWVHKIQKWQLFI